MEEKKKEEMSHCNAGFFILITRLKMHIVKIEPQGTAHIPKPIGFFHKHFCVCPNHTKTEGGIHKRTVMFLCPLNFHKFQKKRIHGDCATRETVARCADRVAQTESVLPWFLLTARGQH
ncbi:hypothetical protein ANANG_G00233380, partial [Anguilla anguilla]